MGWFFFSSHRSGVAVNRFVIFEFFCYKSQNFLFLCDREKVFSKVQKCFVLLFWEYYCKLLLKVIWTRHLNNYFNIKVWLSFCSSVRLFLRLSFQILAPIPSNKSQNVINKSCYICLRGDKNAFGVSLWPLGYWRH